MMPGSEEEVVHLLAVKKEDENDDDVDAHQTKRQNIDLSANQEDDAAERSEDESSYEDSDEDKEMPHHVAMQSFKDQLAQLIVGDPLLSDLPTAVTLEEVNSQIALLHGQAMTVRIRRFDDQVLPVVVMLAANVADLKRAIKRAFMLQQKRKDATMHMSWPYVWRTYWLYYKGEKLTDDNKRLKEYGICNRDEVTFMKKLKQR